MKNWTTKEQARKKAWNKAIHKEDERMSQEDIDVDIDMNKDKNKDRDKEAIARVANFMQEDDETFFRRTIQGLTLPEIEEFLEACPEFRPFWNQDRNEC